MVRSHSLPTPSVVIEWENVVLSKAERARQMLLRLREQLAAASKAFTARPEVIVLYNHSQIDGCVLEALVAEAGDAQGWSADIRVISTDEKPHFEQKNGFVA
jgi:hypothetical protein